MISMDHAPTTLDEADEEILTSTVSDEVLEDAAGAERGVAEVSPSGVGRTVGVPL